MKNQGLSLIEILITIAIFAILAIIATRSTLLSLRSARRSDAASIVRENLEVATASIERQIRNARSIYPSSCTGRSVSSLLYYDEHGDLAAYYCRSIGTNGYIASASADLARTLRLTSSDISIISCSFVCYDVPEDEIPPTIDVRLIGERKDAAGAEEAAITVKTKINIRSTY